MTKKSKISLAMLVVGIGLIGGFLLLPDCSYYGGFQMMNPDAGKSCKCSGLEIYYMNFAPVDGISASKCIGFKKDLNLPYTTWPN